MRKIILHVKSTDLEKIDCSTRVAYRCAPWSQRLAATVHPAQCALADSKNSLFLPSEIPQWGAADAEIKVPSFENTELKRSPFQAWSRSVYSHTCYAYCQEFLPCLFLPFPSIHLHFFQNLSRFFLCWLWLTRGSCAGPQNKVGHPVGCRLPCWVPTENK